MVYKNSIYFVYFIQASIMYWDAFEGTHAGATSLLFIDYYPYYLSSITLDIRFVV